MNLLEIADLRVEFGRAGQVTRPLRGISLTVADGETVGVVGETGCGKTLTGLSVLGLLPAGARVDGSVRLDGRELLGGSGDALRGVRGAQVAMVFQNPGTAFDPVRTIGDQFQRIIRRHRGGSAREARRLAELLLVEVELADAARVLRSYPHQLSGGMLQRSMLALALSCQPRLVIADEATSALDVTVAQQIRRLLLRLQAEHGFGILFVTHNLAEAYDLCDRVYVLYAGEVAESGPADDVFDAPAHPYTRALLAALPRADAAGGPLTALPGQVPLNVVDVRGCVFANRCPIAVRRCHEVRPAPVALPGGRSSACHFAASEVLA